MQVNSNVRSHAAAVVLGASAILSLPSSILLTPVGMVAGFCLGAFAEHWGRPRTQVAANGPSESSRPTGFSALIDRFFPGIYGSVSLTPVALMLGATVLPQLLPFFSGWASLLVTISLAALVGGLMSRSGAHGLPQMMQGVTERLQGMIDAIKTACQQFGQRFLGWRAPDPGT